MGYIVGLGIGYFEVFGCFADNYFADNYFADIGYLVGRSNLVDMEVDCS